MIAFGTVVYNEGMPFFEEFIKSLNAQTTKKFELLVINDGVDESLLIDYLKKAYVKSYIINNTDELNPADLRVKLIEESKNKGYDFLVIGDCDDLFESTRIEFLKNAYEANPDFTFFYNSLLKFDSSPALQDVPEKTISIKQLLQYNYIGMSNSSLRMSALSYDFIESLKGCRSFVFDWYLFSRILCSGGKGLLVKDAITYYRIYEGNFAGLDAELEKELEIKKRHYSMMKKYNPLYKDLLSKINSIDLKQFSTYQASTSFWWDKIIL